MHPKKEKQTPTYLITKVCLLFVFIPTLIGAKPSYTRLKQKAEANFNLLDRLHSTYPLLKSRLTKAKVLKNSWEKKSDDYESAKGKARHQALNELIVTYKQLNSFTETVCVDLRRYSKDIMSDFRDRLKAKRNQDVEPEKYVNSIRVSKYEFHRAEIAYRRKHFRYSAHLFDRGITIIKNTYGNLNWALPVAYK